MENLITVEEFTGHRDVGRKPDNDKINECIRLAQSAELYNIMGGFLFTIIENKDEPTYEDLLEGSKFTYQGRTYVHTGIKALLSDLAYSRYLVVININMTAFGAGSKMYEDSRTTDRDSLRDLVHQAKKDADVKYGLIEMYLKASPQLFPDFIDNCGNNGSKGITNNIQRWDIL